MSSKEQIYGLRAIIEAIKAGQDIDKVFLQKGLRGDLFQQLENLVRQESISVSYVPVEKLNRLTSNNHQGAVASISPISFADLEELITEVQNGGDTPLFLILDQLSDVRNFGAIIRTAECCGVHGIIVQKKGGAPLNADTVKTSAGAIFNIPICKVDHLKDAIFMFQAHDIKVLAATEHAKKSLYDHELNTPLAIIMGSEGKGISGSILKSANLSAKLPMKGEIESLNVSVACGVFLYEVIRQRA